MPPKERTQKSAARAAASAGSEDVAVQIEKETRALIGAQGVDALLINDLAEADIDRISWAGGPSHPQYVRAALKRRNSGEVDYLAVRAPNGWPVCVGGIDYVKHAGAGTMWQIATMPALRSLGIGARLIAAAEANIRQRGLKNAMLGVEQTNPRARALYKRLGYRLCGHEQESWQATAPDGQTYTHQADIDLLKKDL
jgi:ribosomal protein S18 acetylase RimI-like enzyme